MADILKPTPEQTKLMDEIGQWLGTGSINGFGPQFAGKDSNLRPLAHHYDTKVLSGGEILRGDNIPNAVIERMNSGKLIQSSDYQKIVVPHLADAQFVGKPLLLSAVGRKNGEEQNILEAAAAAGHPIRAVVAFRITRDEAFKRLLAAPARGRKDDTHESLARRLDEYEQETLPVLQHYKQLGLLITVDASPTLHIVFDTFIRALHGYAFNKN